jgi:hypothetical protein
MIFLKKEIVLCIFICLSNFIAVPAFAEIVENAKISMYCAQDFICGDRTPARQEEFARATLDGLLEDVEQDEEIGAGEDGIVLTGDERGYKIEGIDRKTVLEYLHKVYDGWNRFTFANHGQNRGKTHD